MSKETENIHLPWFFNEFASCELGDERRTERLLRIVHTLSQKPQSTIAAAFQGDQAGLKAAYRFFDNEQISEEALLAPHSMATFERMRQHPMILAPQDTTFYDLSHHPNTTEVGFTSNSKRRGLLVHSTMAFLPEGLPLGILQQQVWVRDKEDAGKSKERKTLPVEQKESYKWLRSVEALNEFAISMKETTLVSIGDREADLFDLFAMEREPNVELLLRACRERKLAKENEKEEVRYLWESLLKTPIQGEIELTVPRQTKRPARTTRLSVRFGKVMLSSPKHRTSENLDPIELFAIIAQEETPPPNPKEAVKWLLLTTMNVETLDDAQEMIGHYGKRWGIEIYHKVLKSGCKIEELQLESGERLRRSLALYAVIAWRIMYGTMLSRETPSVSCRCFLEEYEWQALFCAVHRVKKPPKEPPTMEQALRMIAQLGGFLGRKRDGHPGVAVIWRGLQRLHDMSDMYLVLRGKS